MKKLIDKLVQTRTNTETGDILNLNQPHKYVKVNVDYSEAIIGLWEGVEMTGYETYGNSGRRSARKKTAPDSTPPSRGRRLNNNQQSALYAYPNRHPSTARLGAGSL